MESSKFLKIVIIILILLNISTVAFVWMHKPPRPPFPPPPPNGEQARDGQGPYRFLVNALRFDDNQQRQYAELRDEHHQVVEAIQELNRDLHKQLYDLLQTKDTLRAQQLTQSIAENQKQIELITFRHFEKVRGICNLQQKLKFDSVINDALRMMSPPPPNGRPGENVRVGLLAPPPPLENNQPPPPPPHN